jgi:Flp pilus assembly protein TadD/4-amino-4-deoxy-L-arabinose transferase-like glycosyltransferase
VPEPGDRSQAGALRAGGTNLGKKGTKKRASQTRQRETSVAAGVRLREDRRAVIVLVVIFVVALALRLIYTMDLRVSPLTEVPTLDELYHVDWARSLAAGDWVGSEVFFRAPLYPYLLGLSFVLVRGSLIASRIIQMFWGSLLPVAIYFLGRRVFDRRAAFGAAAVAAVYPFFVYFDHEFLIVSLVVLLDVLLLTTVLRADEVPSWGRWLLAGVVLGLSATARPNVLAVAPFLALWVWDGARSSYCPTGDPHCVAHLTGRTPFRAAARRVAVLALGTVIVILPVTARNFALERDFVLVAAQGGVNFYIGNNEWADGISAILPQYGEAWQYKDAVKIAELEESRVLKPSEVSGYWYRKGRQFLLAHPAAAARLYVKKLVLFWDRYEHANNKDIYYFGRMSPVFALFSWLHFGVIAPLAVVGMWFASRRNRRAALLLVFIFSYMAGVLLFFVNARYRLPILPALMVFAGAGGVWLFERARRRDLRPLVAGIVLAVVVAVFVNVDFYGTHVGERSQTHYTIGLARASQGRLEEAVESYRRAIEISPNYARAHNNMGLALEQLGRDDEALEAYMSAVEHDPGLASPHNNLGLFYWHRGNTDEAARWFVQALQIDPYLENAHFNLGMVLFETEDLAGAEAHFKSAIVADREFAEAWNALGRVYEVTDRPPQAIAAYTNAVMLAPGFTDARNNLGIVLARTGQYREALQELETALAYDPNAENVRANLEQVRNLLVSEPGSGR